jgi:hypothetical protein
MFESIIALLDLVLGKSIDIAGKIKESEPSKRRQAAQGLLSFYKDLERLKLSAIHVSDEVDSIIRFHQNNEYESRSIENYVKAINEAHAKTMEILHDMFLNYQPGSYSWKSGVHVHTILDFLNIKDTELAHEVYSLLGDKYRNLMVLLTCLNLIYNKQTEKSLKTLQYISNIDFKRIRENWFDLKFKAKTLEDFESVGVVSMHTLEASNLDQLIVFSIAVKDFISKVDGVREKIRKFMADNFTIEELL